MTDPLRPTPVRGDYHDGERGDVAQYAGNCGARDALIAAKCTSPDGTFVHASMADVLAAIATPAPMQGFGKGEAVAWGEIYENAVKVANAIKAYFDDGPPADGGHSDRAGGNAYEVLQWAEEELRFVAGKIVLAAIPALPQAAGMDGAWQPIETAPRDGTSILLGFWYQGRFAQYQAFYSPAGWMENSRRIHPKHFQDWFSVWCALPRAPALPSPQRASPSGISEAEKSARVAALAQARCTTCEGRGYIVKDHTVDGPYIVDCTACTMPPAEGNSP